MREQIEDESDDVGQGRASHESSCYLGRSNGIQAPLPSLTLKHQPLRERDCFENYSSATTLE
ncbi:hypothetical protein OSK93_23630, partial [Escherichia coli]|nr:hypothetical protein [Escherichia coli]